MSAPVNRGGITSASKGGAKAATRAQRAQAKAERSPVRKGDVGVAYSGNTDHLYLESPGPIRDSRTGEIIANDPGHFVEFIGGRTKTYYPDMYAEDAAWVERMERILERGSRTITKFDIKRVEPDKPKLPVNISRWDTLSAKKLVSGLEVMLGDDYAANVRLVEACILYEQEAGKGRADVIKALEAMIEAPAEEGDALDAELEV